MGAAAQAHDGAARVGVLVSERIGPVGQPRPVADGVPVDMPDVPEADALLRRRAKKRGEPVEKMTRSGERSLSSIGRTRFRHAWK